MYVYIYIEMWKINGFARNINSANAANGGFSTAMLVYRTVYPESSPSKKSKNCMFIQHKKVIQPPFSRKCRFHLQYPLVN